jgi:arginine decarboxylase
LTGYQASRILNQHYDIQAEMADWDHVAFIISIADDAQSRDRLLSGLRGLARDWRRRRRQKFDIKFPTDYPPLSLTPREAYFASYRTVPLKQAVGEIPTEFITVYPPGIPVVVPGERITAEAVEYLEAMRRLGAIIVSPITKGSQYIRVVA